MRSILVIGMTGRGKSTYIHENIHAEIPNLKKHIYDPNAEWCEGGKFQVVNEYKGESDIENFKPFLFNCNKNVKYSLIHVEEASIFIDNRSMLNRLRSLIIRKRHTKNIILLTFHALNEVPIDVFSICDTVVLFGTNDRLDLIEKKYSKNPEFIDFFYDVQQKTKENHHYYDVFQITQY
jgi:hypothetical protein